MNKIPYNVLSTEAYIIYLRKSRADSPYETVEEVVAKHEEELQEFAEKELGGRIPEHCIFREVVSGETIDERPVMQEVLSMIEHAGVKAVLVREPSRLSRGDLTDCGRVVSSFRYTNTKVMTPGMTYDLSNKMERKFFEQELMRGNDYLEYTKEILYGGRIRAIKRGCYIGNIPPYGYNKAIIDEMHTLIPNDDADTIRLIFDLHTNQGYTLLEIARHLDSLGVKPMRGDHWSKCSIKVILKNEHYKGLVTFGKKKTVKVVQDGKVIKKRDVPADKDEIVIAKGLHEALVDDDLWNRTQEILEDRARRLTKTKADAPLVNPLAGIFFCKKCGLSMKQHPYKHAKHRYECRGRAYCNTKSVKMDEVLEAVGFILENEKLPELEVRLKNDEGKSVSLQKKQLQKLNEQMEELKKQESKQYELLEKGIYSDDKFLERNKLLLTEMDELKSQIYKAKRDMPKEIDYADKIVKLKKAIKGLKSDEMSVVAKNKLLKAIIDRIEYELVSYEGRGKVVYKLHVFLLI